MNKLARSIFMMVTIAMATGAAMAQAQPSFTTVKNVPYVYLDGTALLMDIDIPKNQGPGPFPAILSIHGGGWYAGNRQDTGGTRMVYRGYVVARLEYRLSNNWKFPAQIRDCKSAIRYLRKFAARYNINPDHIGVWGESAGGHLAALLGTSGGDPYLEGNSSVFYESSIVQAVVDVYGPTDLLQVSSHPSEGCAPFPAEDPRSFYSRYIGAPLDTVPEQVERANPAAYVTPDDPPFFVVHGTADCLVPFHQSQLLVDALTGQGVNVTFVPVPGRGHNMNPYNDLTIRAQINAFLDQHLKGIAPSGGE
jgi:acetyl esterase/lipase